MGDLPKNRDAINYTAPRVVADFGGRRQIFDRRVQPSNPPHFNRRSGEDRRTGFDRRGTLNQTSEDIVEKRRDSTAAYGFENAHHRD